MAPRLAVSQLVMIRDIINSKSLTTSQMAEAAGCSKCSIITISGNLQMFGDVRAPLIPGGRPRIITPIMLEALCNHLLERPDLCFVEEEKNGCPIGQPFIYESTLCGVVVK